MKDLLSILTFCALAAASGAAQDPAPAQPPPQATFRTEVDLVAVDVNIIDEAGKPITGLEADDFVLKVDGKPRRVVTIQYVPAVRDAGNLAPLPTHYSSNERSAGGRMIMIAVDQGNIGSGRGRVAFESAARFISRLSPADRVGLATLPGAGPQIDFTEHHALVTSSLRKLIGQNTPLQTMSRIGVAEAAEIERGNQMTLVEVTDRECYAKTGVDLMVCRRQIESDASTMYSLARQRARNSLMALRNLMERLALTPSQKTIIYMAEELVVDRELADVSWIAEAAARAQAVVYVLQLESPMFDAEIARPSPTSTQDRLLGEEGLGMLASFTRGALLRVIGNADGAFQRLSLELAGHYLLSFEPEAGDRDGRPHKINVSVPNVKDASVRARSEFVIGMARVRGAEELLTETLRAPLLASEIPLKLTTYTLRDPEEDKLRILFSADIDRSANARENLSLAYVLLDAKSAVVGSQLIKDLNDGLSANSRSQNFVAALNAGPSGLYTLKLAVVDESGRRGSVEHTFRAQLSSAGGVRVTDLLLGERVGEREGISPFVTGEVSADVVHGYVELYADSEDVLKDASVAIEIATSEDGRAIESVPARFARSARRPYARAAEAVVPVALLPPGEYVARAVISVGGRTTGQVYRPLRIPATRVARVTSPLGKGRGARPVIPFISRPDAFERSSVLSPQVVGFFMERMDFGETGAAGGAEAIEHARSGRFEQAIDALAASGNQQLATAFLIGLSQYSKGDLEGAAGKFRESLRLNSEFFPAAFYLGACYAAGGRDRQAVGAWQTSLVTESDAPFIYTLLADAFIRLRELAPASDILNEARELWPDSDQVQLRLGTVLALDGKRGEALGVLDPYLERNPADQERRFMLLRMLYEAKRAGQPVLSAAEDFALFDKHASAYKAAGGPQAVLVDEWRKAMK